MDLDAATAAYGLAALSGTFVDTGISGLTLGGGIGFIVASEGFAWTRSSAWSSSRRAATSTSTKSERRNSCGDSAAGEATSAW